MSKLEHIVMHLLKRGIVVRITDPANSATGCRETIAREYPHIKDWWAVEGFYKSGVILIGYYPGTENIVSVDRYGKIEPLCSTLWDDYAERDGFLRDALSRLCSINLGWYMDARDRWPGSGPDSQWLPLLIEHGLIREKVVTTTSYEIV